MQNIWRKQKRNLQVIMTEKDYFKVKKYNLMKLDILKFHRNKRKR